MHKRAAIWISQVTTTPYAGGQPQTPSITEYKYDPDGNRVQKTVDGMVTTYLVDAYNHTGYSQAFVETQGTFKTAYIIGDDVLMRAKNYGPAQLRYLLYDGHGSTRQLADSLGNLVANESYSYDAYGVLLGGPRSTQTNLLYAGEMWDTSAQMCYLRARYYDPLNGRFNQMDPYAGNNQDPQSLHKYLYCHANPINGADPSGRDYVGTGSLTELNVTMAIGAVVMACVVAGTVLNPTWRRAAEKTFEDLIKTTIALVAFAMMPFKDGWRWLKDQWERLKNNFKDREGVYLHYSFRTQAPLLLLGFWLRETFCTRFPYPVGWLAKLFLAMYTHRDPPDAVYIVWPRRGFGPSLERIAGPRPDPHWGFELPGGGTEYVFYKGSGGPGTIFGPIRIPPGSLDDVRWLME